MGCSKCEQDNMPKKLAGSCDMTNQVLEIINAAEIVDFRTVAIPAALGDDTVVKPENNSYRNAIVHYEANDHIYIYGSDGIPVQIKTNAGDFNDLPNRPKYAGNLMTSETDIPSVEATAEELTDLINTEVTKRSEVINEINTRITNLNTDLDGAVDDLSKELYTEQANRESGDLTLEKAIEKEATDRAGAISQISDSLDRPVLYDLEYQSNASTVNVIEDTVNITSGATDTIIKAFPMATETQSGLVSPATYQTIRDTADKMDVILSGTVAIMNIPSDPDQETLTKAWKEATGLTALINGAKIKDVTNALLWTYYSNSGLWYPAEDVSSVDVSQATNTLSLIHI